MNLLSNYIIRPVREQYSLRELGPQSFTVGAQKYYRKDFTLYSVRGRLKCSWFSRVDGAPTACIVYCHGNSGSRKDSSEIRDLVLSRNYSLACFDFGGCGHSDGDYVSLGHYEQQDIAEVVKYLTRSGRVTNVVLWGRSMGAAAVVMYMSWHPECPVVVLDSPFSSLSTVLSELVAQYKFIPRQLRDFAMRAAREHIKTVANFDIEELQPLEKARGSRVPVVIIHSEDDSLVPCGHSKEIFAALEGPKFYLETIGDHNLQRRPSLVLRALHIVEHFLSQGELEDGDATERGNMPCFSTATQELLRSAKCE